MLMLSQALGTHNGVVHVLDHNGERIKSFRPHSASINDIQLDTYGEFVASAAMDGEPNSPLLWNVFLISNLL